MSRSLISHLTQGGDDDIGTMRVEVGGVIALSNADHNSEPAGTSCFHAGEGVFKDDGTNR